MSEQQPARSSAFEQLNLAFFEDGLVIELSEGAHTDEPIYVVHQWSPQASGRMSHPRILVRAGRNSRCTLIEHYLGPPDVEYFTNAVTLIDLDEGAAGAITTACNRSPRAVFTSAAPACANDPTAAMRCMTSRSERVWAA